MRRITDVQSLLRFLAILRADLRERTRSTRFWVLLLLTMAATWKCFPPPEARYLVLSLTGGERGAYSSAWVGMVLAMVYSSLLSLCGFYVVRGTLVRDFETRVWQLLVATPMTRTGFLLAKWASHMAVFSLFAIAGLGVGLLAQWVRAEDRSIHLFEMVKPLLLLNIPGLAITAMLAVWFDLLPWLRRTAGNVVFFVLWITMLSASVAGLDSPGSRVATGWMSDPNGMVMVARDFHRVREAQTGLPRKFGFSVGNGGLRKAPVLFEWKSWTVRPMDAFGRLLWLLFALGGVALAAPLLDWAAARGAGAQRAGSDAGSRLRWLDRLLDPLARGGAASLAVAEMKMALRQRHAWWWLALLVAMALQALAPGKGMQAGLLLAWLLPLDILSRSVLRESVHGTGGLVFSAPGILWRLIATRFSAGFVLLLVLGLPATLRLAADVPLAPLAAIAVSASISAWGLALGALCRNPRPFELLLVGAAYAALQGASLFDLETDAGATLAWHGLGLLPAVLSLAWAWPRLARR